MSRRQALAAVLGGLAVALVLGGCRSPIAAPARPSLELTRFRYNIDEQHAVVRVVGEIKNRGTAAVSEVEIHATLLSAGGSPRGENMTVVQDLRPGQRKTFALSVTSHGGTARVELRYKLPGEE